MATAVFDELDAPKPKRHFTVGIDDDVTAHEPRRTTREFSTEADDVVRCVFYGLGADGTVGANKNSVEDHRRGDAALLAGLLRLRLEEVRLDDGLAPALRPAADPLLVPDRAGAVRRLPPVRPALARWTCSASPPPGATFLLEQPLRAGRRLGPPAGRGAGTDRREAPALLRRSTPTRVAREAGLGRPHQHDHADLLLRLSRRPAARRGDRRDQGQRSRRPTRKRGEDVVRRNFAGGRPRAGTSARGRRARVRRLARAATAPARRRRGARLRPRVSRDDRRQGRSAAGERPARRRHLPDRAPHAGRSATSPRRSRSGTRRSASSAASARSSARTPPSA